MAGFFIQTSVADPAVMEVTEDRLCHGLRYGRFCSTGRYPTRLPLGRLQYRRVTNCGLRRLIATLSAGPAGRIAARGAWPLEGGFMFVTLSEDSDEYQS